MNKLYKQIYKTFLCDNCKLATNSSGKYYTINATFGEVVFNFTIRESMINKNFNNVENFIFKYGIFKRK